LKFIINVDGIDGVGKSTICKNAVNELRKEFKDYDVIYTHYPNYDISTGEYISDMLHDKDLLNMDPYKRALPFIVNRLENVSTNILPYLDDTDTEIYIFDRSYNSNILYTSASLLDKYKLELPLLEEDLVSFSYKSELSEFIDIEYRSELLDSDFYDREDARIYNIFLTYEDKSLLGIALNDREEEKDTYENNLDYLYKVDGSVNIINNHIMHVGIDKCEDYYKYFYMNTINVTYGKDELYEKAIKRNNTLVMYNIYKFIYDNLK
jgi:thymidylate kinase